MISFSEYHYKYASVREGDWFLMEFSHRKQNISIYIMTGFQHYAELMAQLGKYKVGESCLYINKLTDINEDILQKLTKLSIQYVKPSQSTC